MSSNSDISAFRARLLVARNDILSLRETRDDASAIVQLDQSSVGRLSRMDALQQQAMAQSTRQRAEISLQRIEAALRRCDDGTIGLCASCGEDIDPRRLDLDPTAAQCIRCASSGGS